MHGFVAHLNRVIVCAMLGHGVSPEINGGCVFPGAVAAFT
jgi:hypothetical protein